MSYIEINSLDWSKMNDLLPAIIQDAETGKVLMLGYMNQEALIATATTGQLNLYSRSRQRIWRQGESSGHTMSIQHISADCDNDSLLIQVIPKGPACHLGNYSCFQPQLTTSLGFIDELIALINKRANSNDKKSYTLQLINAGVYRCAQKVGEEAVETAIAAATGSKEAIINESADLIFHLLVLLKTAELSFYDVLHCLRERDTSVHT